MLVGAYLKFVEGCETVTYQEYSRLQGNQGEIDVIGIKTDGGREIIACEVATHLGGLDYGGYDESHDRLERKFRTGEQHVKDVFGDADTYSFQLWSPIVPSGLANRLEAMATAFGEETGHDLELLINERYTEKINHLRDEASQTTSQTGDLAFRFLQILEHLRG